MEEQMGLTAVYLKTLSELCKGHAMNWICLQGERPWRSFFQHIYTTEHAA
jgi:hypothetical protein